MKQQMDPLIKGKRSLKMSRRQLLTAVGTGASAIVAGGAAGLFGTQIVHGNGKDDSSYASIKFKDDTVIRTTITNLRQNTEPKSTDIYFVTDSHQEGFFYYDDSDSVTEDDIGLTIVSTSGARFKRICESGFANVMWFGAKADGVNDDTTAFLLAFGEGKRIVYAPKGTYRVQGLKVPSHTTFRGDGIDRTIIKLTDDAPNGTWVITNRDYEAGNTNIVLEDFTADWNLYRPNVSRVGNQASSCVTLANAYFCWIRRVKAVDSLLHCFDVTSPRYAYDGDDVYAEKPSRYVWISDCIADGFEDDGFTTHHSEYIFIENCYATGAAKAGMYPGASVGYEIDDGSRNVWVTNCVSDGNVRGFMAKGHRDSPAANGIHFTNCTSIADTRSFELLHILHHASTDPVSPNAFDVTITNCVAYYPERKAISLELTQRALCISAYARVRVNGFTAIGDPTYDYQSQPVIAVQTKARFVTLDNIHVTGFESASTDVNIAGGVNSGNYFQISNVTVQKSSPNGIFIGSGLEGVMLSNIQLQGHHDVGSVGLKYYSEGVKINNVSVHGYAEIAYAPNSLILDEVIEVPKWETAVLLHGWKELDAAHTPRYTKSNNGFVYVFGVVRAGTMGAQTPIMTLPAPYRPKRNYSFITHGQDPGVFLKLTVYKTGDVTAESWGETASARAEAGLDAIVFPTDI